jgi:hypothetical protein
MAVIAFSAGIPGAKSWQFSARHPNVRLRMRSVMRYTGL